MLPLHFDCVLYRRTFHLVKRLINFNSAADCPYNFPDTESLFLHLGFYCLSHFTVDETDKTVCTPNMGAFDE